MTENELSAAFYPHPCQGWRGPCGTLVTPETERIFGEALMCPACERIAWDDFAEAVALADDEAQEAWAASFDVFADGDE